MSGSDVVSFIDEAERQLLLNAQTNTIIQQSKKITHLEAEIEHLKRMLASNTPLLTGNSSDELLNINDEETISRTQLRLLRDVALTRELTFEEVKKCQCLVDILYKCTGKKTKNVVDLQKVDGATLLQQLEAASDE